MLNRVETQFRLLGYPGLAIICFGAAAADAGGDVSLVLTTFLNDPQKNRRTH